MVNSIDYNASPVKSSSSWFMQRARVLRISPFSDFFLRITFRFKFTQSSRTGGSKKVTICRLHVYNCPFVVSTSVLKVDPVLDYFPLASWCFWGVRTNRGVTLLWFARFRCSFRLNDVSPAVLVTNQILWNICFSQGFSECFPSLSVEIFPFD